MKRETTLLLASLGTFLLHMLVAGRYDFFRDELYFIICGRHPAFGYVDQPPLIPLLAALTQLFGENLVLLRSLPALAAGATVYATGRLAMLFDGGTFAVIVSALAVAVAPISMGLMTTLGTSTFEPLVWTLVTYFVTRAVIFRDAKAWILLGLVAGLGLEARYFLPFYLVPLLVSLIIAGHRKKLWNRHLATGLAVGGVIAVPSFVWQLIHGLPFLELLHNGAAEAKNVVLPPLPFIRQQLMVMNPVFAPLWLGGVFGPFLLAELRPYRFIASAFVLVFGLMMAMHAKDYCLTPAYPAVLALGAVLFEFRVKARWLRIAWALPALAYSAIAAPVAMPILAPPDLARYLQAIHTKIHPAENKKQSEIPELFADMVGWRSYVEGVAHAFKGLSPEERLRAVLVTSNYGEAAALDFFGGQYGLPPARSGHNNYWLWGPGYTDGAVILRINASVENYRTLCRSSEVVGTFGDSYAMPYENNAPIVLCRDLNISMDEYWLKLKHYI